MTAFAATPRWRINVRWLAHLRLLLGLSFPLLAAVALFGWRVAGAWALVLLGALMGRAMLGRLNSWVATPGRVAMLTQSLLVTLFFPATLFDIDLGPLRDHAQWPALMGAGMTLAMVAWVIRRCGTARFHPVPWTLLIMALGGPSLVLSDRVLQREDVFATDILDGSRLTDRATATAEPWYEAPPLSASAIWITAPAAERLADFLRGEAPQGRPAQTIARLVSDDLPPLEDLVIGGHPARAGCASAVAIMIGGLFLVYRGVVAFRVPVLMLIACYITLMVLPMPIVVGHDEVTRHWLVPLDSRVGWAMSLTLIHYILTASPILLTTLLLAVLPGVRPIGIRAGTAYAVVFGVLCAVCTLFISFNFGAIVAVALSQLIVPTLDRWLPTRPAI